jgi:SAM-dependent methyltransferase
MIALMQRAEFRQVPPYSTAAQFYDLLIGRENFRRARRILETLATRYGLRFRSAADIGCGTGRFACFLSRRWGVPVWAVDRSPAMLRAAARICRTCGVRLLRQDIRRLRLPAKVELITANSDTLNHLKSAGDFKRALHSIWCNLMPGGHFVFDLVTPTLSDVPRSWGRRVLVRGGSVDHLVAWRPGTASFRTALIHRRHSAAASTVEIHDERAYDPVDVGRWLREAGFILRAVLDADSLAIPLLVSPRLVFLTDRP